MKTTMTKIALSLVLAGALAACAGPALRPQRSTAPEGHWQGFLLRNGLREPVAVDLSGGGSSWDGKYSAGFNSVPLAAVRVTGTNVHFELPGESFDGSVAGDNMAGSVSGQVAGSFALVRIDEPAETPYPNGP